MPALAADLVKLGVDVIVTGANPGVLATMKATTTIPIVGTNLFDPVGAGLVASLARPGGNVTGVTGDTGHEIWGKRLELLKETLPNLSRIGILWNPDVRTSQLRMTSTEEAARALGLTLFPVNTPGPDAFEQAFAIMMKEPVQAFVLLADTVLFGYRDRIAEMALRNRLPGTSDSIEFGESGFLFVYGVRFRDLLRQSAVFVDKILKGAKPGELPIERPTKFNIIINLQTAKALGITMPPTLLIRADEVIE
jgi:putative ABC transport system substrate-binding protein